jgi:putative membrane protein
VLALLFGQPVLAAGVAAYALVSSLVVWWRRTWSFDGTTITLDDGVLRRTYRRVPVTRIQQVEVNEPLVHRLVGLAVVRIETAGGAGQAEVHLDALTRAEASRLQQAVLVARARALVPDAALTPGAEVPGPALPPPPAPEQVILRLSTARIMLGGIVSSNLLVVFALMGGFLDITSRLPRNLGETVETEAGELVGSLGIWLGLMVLFGLALVAAALSAVAAHHDLTVVRAGDELRLRRGLFERRDAVVPLARVQSVAIRQNPAQRLLGLSSLRIRSAGTAQEGDVRLMVPVATPSEVESLVAAAVGREVSLDDLAPAPSPARSRRIVRRLAVLAAVVTPMALLPGLRTPAVVVAVLVGPAAVLLGLDAYRNLGHRFDGDLVVTRWGSLLRRTVVVVVGRVQSTRVRSSPFQRLRGLATLAIDLAGRGIAPVVIDQSAARCTELDHQIRAAPVSWSPTPYATLDLRSHPAPNEEP